MRSKLVIVADLGRMRAYRFEDDPDFSNPRLRLVDDLETHVTNHLSEELTDQAGQFRKGPVHLENSRHDGSDGEQHNLDLERRRRAVKMLAGRITLLMQTEGLDGCFLAADRRINQPILDELDARTRSRVQKVIHANLSKMSPEEIITHFAA